MVTNTIKATKMEGKGKILEASLCILVVLALSLIPVNCEDEVHPNARVSWLPIREVSFGGGVITIFGSNFAADNFNQFEPDLGNRVLFSNDYETLECKTPVERNFLLQNPQASSTTKVLCNLPPRGTTEGGEWYNLAMFVDGKKVSNSHNQWIRFRDRRTPKVTEILSSRYTKVEEKISFYGRIISNLYGKAGTIEEPLVDSDSTTSQLGVFLGGQECDLMDPNGNLYGINLSDQNDCGLNGACGDITCKVKGTLVGPLSVEYHVSNYGASQTDLNMYNIDSKGQVYHFHTLGSVDSVSQTSGTTGGGQLIEITGSGFDSAPGKTKVYLGEAECDIEKVTNSMVSVRTPPQPSGGNTGVFNSMYAGGAGLQYKIWLGTGDVDTSTGLDGIMSTLGAEDNSTIINTIADISEPVLNETDDYTSILSGFYICTFTGEYEIELETSGHSTLYLANLTSNTMEAACTNDHGTSQGTCSSDKLRLEKGEKYYLAVVYNHVSGAPLKLRLGLKAYATSINSKQHPSSKPEKQRIRFLEYRRNEMQKVEFIGDTLPENVTFTMSGVNKDIEFSTTNITEDMGWSSKLKQLLSPTCMYQDPVTSSVILDPNDKSIIKCDFEKCLYQGAEESKNDDTSIYGQNGWHSNDHEAYCGRGVMWNTDRFLRNDYTVKLQDYPYVCFAYRGNAFKGYLNVYVEYTKINNTEATKRWLNLYPDHPNNIDPEARDVHGGLYSELDIWQYRCYNVYDLIKFSSDELQIDEFKPVWLQEFKIPFDWGDGLVSLVDEIRFSKQDIGIIRIDAALPTNEMLISEVEVVDDKTNNATKIITFETVSCDEFKFDLLGIHGAFLEEISSNDTMAINEYLSSNENATFSHPDWGNSTIRITRIQDNSIRSTGTYSISYKGKTLPNLDFYLEDYELERLVQQGLDAPTVTVSQGGRCWWKNYDFKWENEGGEKPLITIDTSTLMTDGTTLTNYTEKKQTGHIEINELGPDFFRTPHDEPQISVVVSNYRSWCDSANGCGYTYSAPGSEPTMVSYTEANNELIITGTDFDAADTAADRKVRIDERFECTVTAVTDTKTTCTFDPLPAGDYPIRLFVDSFGEALGSITMTITLQVDAISPTSGALGGGTTLQITGSGFSETDTKVTINEKTCQITSTSVESIECITPGNVAGTYPVTVSFNGETDDSVSFTYDTASTAIASSHDVVGTLSPVTVKESKTTITITGTTFGDDTGSVKIGTEACVVDTWSDTTIVCRLPVLTGGTYDIAIETASNGYANTNALTPITYSFKVSSISPRVGSLQGGTKMVIIGEGFTSDYCQNVDIMIGDNMKCDVGDCTDTEIICTTKRIPTIHKVDNTGMNAKFGRGYAWDKKDLTIAPGDIVEWRWVLTVSSADSGINIMQREDAGSTMYDGVGFNSGEKKAEGTFRHTFNGLGTSYYTSDSVIGDLNTVFMSGSVTVELPAESAPMSIRAMIGDVAAEMDVARVRSAINKRSSCADADTSCVAPSINDSFAFTASPCLTPVVTMITVTDGMVDTGNKYLEGHAASTIEIQGSGFGNLCQTTVMIGTTNCSISTISSSNIVCSISASDEILPESLHLIEVSVSNNGLAVFEDEKYSKFHVKSMISNVNIDKGSFAGGSVMIFNGLGLKVDEDDNHVIFTTSAPEPKLCSVVNSTYTQLTCRTPNYEDLAPTNELIADVSVKIAGYEPVWDDAVFSSNETVKHRFNYTSTATPSVEAGDVVLSGGQGTIKVNGTMFGGSAASVRVYLVSSDAPNVVRRTLHPYEDSAPDLAFHRSLNKKVMSEFFRDTLHNGKLNKINWKIGGSGNRHLGLPSYSMEHFKDSVRHTGAFTLFEDDYPLHHHLADEEDKAVVEKLMKFVQRHTRSNVQKLQTNRRVARGAEELQGVEEDVNNMDSSYFGTIDSVSDGSITVTFNDVQAGSYNLMVYVDELGNALKQLPFTATSQGIISSISPDTGSTYGGQEVTITGQGFSTDSASWNAVNIGSTSCQVKEATFSEIKCITSSNDGTAETVSVEVSSGVLTFEGNVSYTFSTASTPTASTVSPTEVSNGTSITIDGSNFDGVTDVIVGNSNCIDISSSSSQITCNVGFNPGGLNYKMKIVTPNGVSDESFSDGSPMELSYALTLSLVSPDEGSTGGGTEITLTGSGFDPDFNNSATEGTNIEIKVCDELCINIEVTSENTITCLTPMANNISADTTCDVVLTQSNGGESKAVTSAGAFVYKFALTPTVSGVSPNEGGSGGGTRITISGSFSMFPSETPTVSIDGSPCILVSNTNSEIVCDTEAHSGSGTFPVTVEFASGNSVADTADSNNFRYVDRWSSIWTWGGGEIPQEDEFIVLVKGQTIVLDVTTPKLSFLLLNGGNLIFDKDVDGLQLNSEFILIMEDSVLEVGTEDEPFEKEAEIIMHGHTRCTELPIYGCKVIAVRKGALELHGRHINHTWTHLTSTANVGDTQITVELDVSDWRVGDEIVIASTNDRHSMGENEKHKIASIDSDGKTITLENALKFKHISLTQTFGDHEIKTRAEVGLLTRNIKVMGSQNTEFFYEIEACDRDFDSNQFATQTCFAGKFGEELGSDEFGSTLLANAKNKDLQEAEVRISYVEFFWVGQAFRVGRYPIHFHLLGNVNGSYSRGNAVHNSFNRATTIHGISEVVVEHCVTYNIKGLSFFIEDGVEENNVVQYNLAVYTRQSSSLLNPDVTPAAFWIVNANNKIRHNTAAGGTHFGFWFRTLAFPDGPSETKSYCTNRVPLGEFRNNTAHTVGWYGIWIFSMDGWFPSDGTPEGGYCNWNNEVTATFEDFTAWRCERGAEIVFGGKIKFDNFKCLDNEKAGVDFVEVRGPIGQSADGPAVNNSVIVAHSNITAEHITDGEEENCTHVGVFAPKLYGITVSNTEFYNFDQTHINCAAMSLCSQCKPNTAGFPTYTENLKFENSPNKISFRWAHGGVFKDMDGTLMGTAGGHVVPTSPMYPPDDCTDDSDGGFSVGSGGVGTGVPSQVCNTNVGFSRVGLNHPVPESLLYDPLVMTTTFGNDTRPWNKKDVTHPKGWSAIIPQKMDINMHFQNFPDVTNLSYDLSVWQINDVDDYVIISHNFNNYPDAYKVHPDNELLSVNESLSQMPDENSLNGEFYWNNDTKVMSYILSGNDGRRGIGVTSFDQTNPIEGERRAQPVVYRCFYRGCEPPPPPTIPPGRPSSVYTWSSDSDWADMGIARPADGEDLNLPAGVYLIIDEPNVTLGQVIINGADPTSMKRQSVYPATIEIDDHRDHVFTASNIFLRGGQFRAGEWGAYEHKLEIRLTGDSQSNDHPLPGGTCDGVYAPELVMGAKSIGNFGELSLEGKDVGMTWTKLAATASAGSDTLVLVDTLNCQPGDEVFVTTSSFRAHEGERMVVASVSGNTLTLTAPLVYTHRGDTYNDDESGITYTIAAEVGLLSRNIKIIGESFPGQDEKEFGCRVLVGRYCSSQYNKMFTGVAKLKNVEFVNCGQRGFIEDYDPRYSVAFMDIGDTTTSTDERLSLDSWVLSCSFNYNYNPAIGVFGSTSNLRLENNVVYRTFDYGVIDKARSNKWIKNLVAYTIYAGTHLKGRGKSLDFHDCITIDEARDITFKNNVAAGCERGGLRTDGETCGTSDWTGNEVHGSMHGVRILNDGSHYGGTKCASLSGWLVWNVYDYGFFLSDNNKIELSNNMIVDSSVGVMSVMGKPNPVSHEYNTEAMVTIKDCTFIGYSPDFDCNNEPPLAFQSSPGNFQHKWNLGHFAITLMSWGKSSGGEIPLVWNDPHSYNALMGTMYVRNSTFANYGTDCAKHSSVFRTQPGDEDFNFPVIASGVKYVNVSEDHYVFWDRPSLGKVNPSDCVDFPCDAKKKALIIDEDGSVSGNDGVPTTIIPDAAYQWDGDRRYGTGYYRVPSPMVTNIDGSKIPYEDKMPNKGIVRNGNCVEVKAWNGYRCTGIDHRIMIIESMDKDTEIRRLSPVAVLVDGYVDLVNGPQDHGWCFGYTCQERLSTFHTMVALGKEAEVFMTSTPPLEMRFFLLNSNPDQSMRVKFWFPKSQRYDVYVDNRHISANNYFINENNRYDLKSPDDSYIPTINSTVNGENYFDPITNFLYITLTGGGPVTVKTAPVVVLKFGATVSEDDFFDPEKVADNIAALLGIDPSKIKVANIVRENSRRSLETRNSTTETVTFDLEISDPPVTTIDNTTTNSSDSNDAYNNVTSAADSIINAIATGGTNGSSLFGGNATMDEVQVATLPTAPKEAGPVITADTPQETSGETYADQIQAADAEALATETTPVPIAVPTNIEIIDDTTINSVTLEEMVPFPLTVPLKVALVDNNSALVENTGTASPWEITASLAANDAGAVLIGDTTAQVINGYAEFPNIYVDKRGSGYEIEFAVSSPASSAVIPLTGVAIPEVNYRPLSVKFTSQPILEKKGVVFTQDVVVSIWDDALDMKADLSSITNVSVIAPDHTSCELTLHTLGQLDGTTTATIDANGDFTFSDLIVSETNDTTEHQLSVSCSDENNVISFGPEISDTFIVHQYCEDSQPTEMKIQLPSCLLNDSSVECNGDALSTLFGSSIQEFVTFPDSIKVLLVDTEGNHIENPGTEPTEDGLCSVLDPWKMEVTITGASFTTGSTTEVSFSGGVAEFDNLAIDSAGSGFTVTFSISYSSQGNAVSSLTLAFPDVDIRPLRFKLTSAPSLEKHGEPFATAVVATLWDEINDIKADASLVSAVGSINCKISLVSGGAKLTGTKTVSMNAGGICKWNDLTVTNTKATTRTHTFSYTYTSARRLRLRSTSLPSEEKDVIIEARTHARKASMAMEYTGPVENVQPAINLFNKVAVDGRDDITVKEVGSKQPKDNSWSKSKVKKVKNACRSFPSSANRNFC